MKHKKYVYTIFETIILSAVAWLAFTTLNTEYLFGWAAHNWQFYLFLSVSALLLIVFNKQIVSVYMTLGIVVGIFAGNYLGNSIKEYSEEKIVEGMKAEEIYRHQHHPGFEIWIGIILLSIICGIFIQNIKKSYLNNRVHCYI